MTLIDRLKQYNAWRRSDGFDHLAPHDPTQIGNDIDEAIAKLAALCKAVEDYCAEVDNPAPDFAHRKRLRDHMLKLAKDGTQ